MPDAHHGREAWLGRPGDNPPGATPADPLADGRRRSRCRALAPGAVAVRMRMNSRLPDSLSSAPEPDRTRMTRATHDGEQTHAQA
jgi:hypothetical protein